MRSRCWCKGSVRRKRSELLRALLSGPLGQSNQATRTTAPVAARYVLPLGVKVNAARNREARGRRRRTGMAERTPCRKRRADGVGTRRRGGSEVPASVCRNSGAESRFFIGVQFWRVTVRASGLGRHDSIVDLPETRRAKSSRNHEQRTPQPHESAARSRTIHWPRLTA